MTGQQKISTGLIKERKLLEWDDRMVVTKRFCSPWV